MNEHKNNIKGMSADELADLFSTTTYGYQRDFFYMLSEYYHEDSDADLKRGYSELSGLLDIVTTLVMNVNYYMKKMWKICEPKMDQ